MDVSFKVVLDVQAATVRESAGLSVDAQVESNVEDDISFLSLTIPSTIFSAKRHGHTWRWLSEPPQLSSCVCRPSHLRFLKGESKVLELDTRSVGFLTRCPFLPVCPSMH